MVVGSGGGASPNEENSMRVGAGVGVGVVEEHRQWGGSREGRRVGTGCSVGGPCGVLYGKNQR